MKDGNIVALSVGASEISVSFEVTDVPDSYSSVMFGPIFLNIDEVVGDIIGVVQGNGVAFGMQALNIKTIAGIPLEYDSIISAFFDYVGNPAVVSTSTIPFYRLAATDIGNGTVMQFSCRKRNEIEYRRVSNMDKSLTLPVKGDDALIKGAKIAFFGCKSADALAYIGKVEIEHGLPHPVYEGEWAKTNRASTQPYLITEFSPDNVDIVIEKAKRAGFNYIYQMEPFETWGHFTWNKNFVDGDDAEVKKMVDYIESYGLHLGIHTLTNFITVNDEYVTPVPSQHLLKQAVLKLKSDIDATTADLVVEPNDYFSLPMTLNALQTGDEIISYGEVETKDDGIILHNCQRGAFGTTAAAHKREQPLYKLWDYPYKTLFPDLELQDKMADRLVEIFNATGIRQISFDGLEGCCYTGQDDYATARFVTRCYDGWNNEVINDASNLGHYTWHIHNRMNWGEPWGEEMRAGQVENRIKNQAFFSRNLFPRMLGWFLIRLADKKFECTTLEDLEWALSESAGFDAGYAMTVGVRTLERHGQIDRLMDAINNWNALRNSQLLSDKQREVLRDPATEWHLGKAGNDFVLYPIFVSPRYHCSLGEMQPGQSGGSDWSWTTTFSGPFALRIYVDGEIDNPSFKTSEGVIKFPCKISNNQYLLYDFDGTAVITDKNYNVIKTAVPQGMANLSVGTSAVAFSCDCDNVETEVTVRFITRGEPEIIKSR